MHGKTAEVEGGSTRKVVISKVLQLLGTADNAIQVKRERARKIRKARWAKSTHGWGVVVNKGFPSAWRHEETQPHFCL